MDTTTIDDLSSDVLAKILLLLDGPDLAAAATASPSLRSSAAANWHLFCLSNWPSLRRSRRLLPLASSRGRRLFAEAFPLPLLASPSPLPTTELISAVDIYRNGEAVFSAVVATDTRSPWFQSAPFQLAVALPRQAVVATGELTLSWIVVEPVTGKAVNLSSRRPVSSEGGRVKFALVLGGRAAAVVEVEASCEGEVALSVEDEEGKRMNGSDAVAVIRGAMEGPRSWAMAAEVGERYREHERRRAERARRSERTELACAFAGASAFAGFLLMMMFA